MPKQKFYFDTLLLMIFALLLIVGCQSAENEASENEFVSSSSLRWQLDQPPLISAHRGGPSPGFPENCIETFAQTLKSVPAMLECDVSITRDGHLVLMHDEKVDRTTNGTGYIDEMTLTEVKSLKLKDARGNLSNFKVPTLKEALSWARGKALLSLDVKRGVPFAKVIELIESMDAEDDVTVIVYTVKTALKVYGLNPNLKISATIRNQDEYERLRNVGIPDQNIIAFTGLRGLSASHYEMLHKKGIMCILGAIGNIDKRAKRRGDQIYQQLVDRGIDVIATDRPLAAAKALGLID